MAVTGSIGTAGDWTNFTQPRSLNVTLPAGTYPSGVVTFSNIGAGSAYWKNNSANYELSLDIYLCDSAGNNAVKLFNVTLTKGATDISTKTSGTISVPGLAGQALYLKGVGSERALNSMTLQNATSVVIDTAGSEHTVTCAAVTGGSVVASPASATAGSTVTLFPTASTGYYLTGYTTSPSVTVTNNTFTMPDSDITVTPSFAKRSYTITKAASPSGSGTVTTNKNSANYGDTITLSASAGTGYQFSSWSTSPSVTITNNSFTMPASDVTVTANFAKTSYTISKAVSPSGGGTVTTSKSSATMGESITLTATPATGYTFSSWSTSPSVTVSNNKFTMPAGNITVTATFIQNGYTITKSVSPSGAGSVTTSKNSAAYGETITISQTPATGYEFDSWSTSPSVTISGGSFTMPAANLSITANYRRRSTCTISKTTMTDGDSVTLTINSESSAYSYKYELSFGTNMTTGEVSVPAGTTNVTITIPSGSSSSWARYLTSATSQSGSLTLKTYSGSTQISTSYTITGLTYKVPDSAVPTISNVHTYAARTIDGRTYPSVGSSIAVQNHVGLRAVATGTGALGATIASMAVAVSGYSGSRYNAIQSGGSLDFTTGLLSVAGDTTVTITATDSRGKTSTYTHTFTVHEYNNPSGTLDVWRTDAYGDVDEYGQYGAFSITKNYSAIGNNSLTATLSISSDSADVSSISSGQLLPGNVKTFGQQQEYMVTLTLADVFETTVITRPLSSARYIIYVNANGNKLGFMKATNMGAADANTIEFNGNSTIYIGSQTLAQYIRSAMNPAFSDMFNNTYAGGDLVTASLFQCTGTVNLNQMRGHLVTDQCYTVCGRYEIGGITKTTTGNPGIRIDLPSGYVIRSGMTRQIAVGYNSYTDAERSGECTFVRYDEGESYFLVYVSERQNTVTTGKDLFMVVPMTFIPVQSSS